MVKVAREIVELSGIDVLPTSGREEEVVG